MNNTKTVSRDEWLDARKALLADEKKLIDLRDAVAAKRQELPWVQIEKDYRFEGPEGEISLTDLFAGRSQLIVQHFMFGPGWREGCVGCSFLADHIDGPMIHLAQKGIRYVAVARAPYSEIATFRKRMGWRFPWVSSHGGDFNFDFGVSFTPDQIASGTVEYNFEQTEGSMDELPGFSVFFRDHNDAIYHTYSSYGRSGEEFVLADRLLEISPLGRHEYDSNGKPVDWIRHHDKYDQQPDMSEIAASLTGNR